MFSYPNMSEEQANEARKPPLLPEGDYEFHVELAAFKMSNSGKFRDPSRPSNPMIELTLAVWDNTGRKFEIIDWLVGSEKMQWKTRHFCRAVGLEAELDAGTFNENHARGKHGTVRIIVAPGGDNPKGGTYPDKNRVEDYLAPTGEPRPLASKAVESNKGNPNDPLNGGDDIPF